MIKSVLHRLCSLSGVSGCEDEVGEYIVSELKGVAEVKIDNLGNIIAFKKGKQRSLRKVLFSAHMDEVGLIITKINDDGYLRFSTIGGIDTRVLISARVKVGKNKVNGIIGIKAVHLLSKEEKTTVPKLSSLYIDIGAKNKDDALKYINEGDIAEFDSDFVEFGDNYIKSKAIDDRFGCLALIELCKKELLYDTYFAFTVSEEIGLRGAFACAYEIKPEIVVVVEATTAVDLADIKGENKVCSLNCGAVIPFMDKQTIYDKKLFKFATELANEKQIKWQTKTKIAGGNDAGAFQRSLAGIRVLSVCVPCRYLHTPSCVINFYDCEHTEKLLFELIQKLGGESNV